MILAWTVPLIRGAINIEAKKGSQKKENSGGSLNCGGGKKSLISTEE